MATQSLRSTGRELHDSGTAGIQLRNRAASVPSDGSHVSGTRIYEREDSQNEAVARNFSCAASAAPRSCATGSASAAEITYVSVTGIWHDPMDNLPGSQPGDPVITNGIPTSIIRWGTTSGTPQSGYDFTATIPPPLTLPGPIPFFSLGTFTHRNFEVDDPSLTSVQLDVVLVLSVDGVPPAPLTFTFTFNHEETPNNPTPCPYPTPPGEGCTDRVTIVASAQPTTFNVDGVDYTLSMSFLDQRQSGVRIHHERRRHHQHLGPRGAIHVAAGHAGAHGDEVGPGDDESGGAGRFRHRRAEHGGVRRVQRDAARSAAERPDRAGCATPRRKS